MQLEELLSKHDVAVQAENATNGYVVIGPFRTELKMWGFLAEVHAAKDIPLQYFMQRTWPLPSTEEKPCFARIKIGSGHPLYPKAA